MVSRLAERDWNRWPSNRGSSAAQAREDSLESGLEQQNDSHLNELHSKLQALRGVTTDIYRDSLSQNTLLDTTVSVFPLNPRLAQFGTDARATLQGNSFDGFKTSLGNTSNRFVRSVQNNTGQARLQLSIVGGIIALFVLYKLFHSTATP